jgi:hypothetical protein
MERLEDHFNDLYYQKRKHIAWRAPVVCAAIKKVFNPFSVIDVGCSIGEFVEEFNNMGIHARGIDGSKAVTPHFMADPSFLKIHDLRKKVTGYKADFCMCIEVFTIFEDEYKKQLLKNLTGFANKVLIGAAEHQRAEVLSEMNRLKYDYLADGEIELRRELEHLKTKPAIKALYHNSMYFEKI